jgi:hypothetical protein
MAHVMGVGVWQIGCYLTDGGKMGIRMSKRGLDLWTEALESGKYPQGEGWLCQISGEDEGKAEWCCLGVLCDVAIKDGLQLEQETGRCHDECGDDAHSPVVKFAGYDATLPPEVRDHFDFEQVVEGFGGAHEYISIHKLIKWNDSSLSHEHKTFPEIAAKLREFVEVID